MKAILVDKSFGTNYFINISNETLEFFDFLDDNDLISPDIELTLLDAIEFNDFVKKNEN